jgi:isocitrate dehydrogenase
LNKDLIIDELIKSQGSKQDLDGYYLLDKALAKSAMRPSTTLNKILNEF